MNIPELSVKKPVTMSMVILIIVILGFISLTHMGMDLMPDITYPILTVVINYPGASSEDIENLITKPVEEILSTVKGVKKINSISQEGFSAILIEFEWGTNLDTAAQDLRDNIELYKEFLPQDMKNPLVLKFDVTMIPVMVYTLTGKRDLFSLRKVTEDFVKDRLEQIDGVASVMVYGGYQKEIAVELKKSRLEAYKLNIDMVINKLRMENINLPGGYVNESYKEYVVRTQGELKSIEDIKNIVVTMAGKIPIYIKDIADVKETHKEVRSYTRTNKENAVLFMVSKESGANTVVVSNKVEKELKKIEKTLPHDIKMYNIFSQSRIIKRILSATTSNAVAGGLLAAGILFFFLANLRPTILVSAAIPLSIFAAFIPLYFLGHTLNFITMAGIALGVGMLVDNSIVVIENIFRHRQLGEDSFTSSIKGASEVGMAITASTLTTIAVFLPLIFATGITGKLFWPLALTVTCILTASLFVSLTVIPMISSRFFTGKDFLLQTSEMNSFQKWEKNVTSKLHNAYSKIIGWALSNRRKVIYSILGAFLLSIIIAIFFMGKEFFPKMDHNMFTVMVRLPTGVSVDETDKITRYIEDIFMEEKDIISLSSIVGLSRGQESDAAMGSGPSGGNEAQFYVRLKDLKDRKKSSQEILKILREKVPNTEKLKVEFMEMGSMMMGGASQKPVEIKIYGKDIDTLEKISSQIIEQLKSVRGIFDPSSNLVKGKPELVIKINREKISRFGLTTAQVASTVQSAFQGKIATRIHRAGEEIDVTVKLKEDEKKYTDDIKNFPITTMLGTTIPLKDIARFEYMYGPIKLFRENQKRTVTITANVSGRDLAGAINDIKKKVKNIFMPEGYFIDYKGEFEQMKDTFIDLFQIFILSLLLIYMVMAAEFESFLHPFIIMFTVPMAIIGVIILLFITGKTISLPMGMGLLVLAGVIVNNGIVMIDYINQLRKRGKPKYQAIVEGALTRLRPVLMTSLTTILGLIPMAVDVSEGHEMRSTLSLTLIGGLLVGTFLTLVVVPVIYSLFTRKET